MMTEDAIEEKRDFVKSFSLLSGKILMDQRIKENIKMKENIEYSP